MQTNGTNRPPKIFISYRHVDTSGYVNHLHETLAARFGDAQVFRDIHDLKPGVDFADVIRTEVESCDVVLVVIGKSWTALIKQKQAEGQEDFVRYEVAAALKLRPKLLVVPVLVQGASFPAKQELPEDLQQLVKLNASILSDRWWPQDVGQLVNDLNRSLGIEGPTEARENGLQLQAHKPRRSNSENSIVGGSLAGLITGTVVGILYTVTEGLPWWRFPLVSFYGLLAGALVSWSINAGVERVSRLMGNARIAKLIGGVVGGSVGGFVAGLIGGFGFAWLPGNVVNPGWVVAAVAISSIFITCGILLPDLRHDWRGRLPVLIPIAAIAVGFAFLVGWLLFEKINVLDSLSTRSPTSLGVIILGLLCGAMAGAQVGMALLFYESRPRHPAETS
ncbi:MAG TPA: toll/interleukin-1 receptor domain-containing protein [Pyrinomonadaceae bacterium]|nr:toll/interleukin-1 receptor domain-containing protein [Pyrinomonadaceae bacterium]